MREQFRAVSPRSHHLEKIPLLAKQDLWRTLLDHPAVAQGDDAVHLGQHRLAMRNNERSSTLRQLAEGLFDGSLRLEIKVGGGLVEDQEPGSAPPRTGP